MLGLVAGTCSFTLLSSIHMWIYHDLFILLIPDAHPVLAGTSRVPMDVPEHVSGCASACMLLGSHLAALQPWAFFAC